MAKNSAAKNTAWKWFSKYIRLRDCLRTTGQIEYGRCISCGKIFPFGEGQAGHYIPGRRDAYLYEETNCHFQCVYCNYHLHGNTSKQMPILIELYGKTEIERLETLRHVKRSIKDPERRAIATEYRLKCKDLLNG